MIHDEQLLLALSGDIHLKSKRTRRRLERILGRNLREALAPWGDQVTVRTGPTGRWSVVPAGDDVDLHAVAASASRVFGIQRVEHVRAIRPRPLDALVDDVAQHYEARVSGRRFAVRAKSRGDHDLDSMTIQRAVGSRLLPASAGVDLDDPDVTVHLQVWPTVAFVEQSRTPGDAGLPLGSQPRALGLLSGGFDSPVAAWMLMRRGVPVDFVHFQMECAQSEHATAVAHELWRRWGAGTSPELWQIDFQDVKRNLQDHVESGHRQVALKRLMLAAAEALAVRTNHEALVTGDSLGQVSSQTLTNLTRIDADRSRPVLRPLVGFTKEEIITRARQIGTHDLSARAREVCDLSSGPVETAADEDDLRQSMAGLPDDLVEQALATSRRLDLPSWMPGDPGQLEESTVSAFGPS